MSKDVFTLLNTYLRVWISIEFSVEIVLLPTLKAFLHCLQPLSAEKSDAILIPKVLYETFFSTTFEGFKFSF